MGNQPPKSNTKKPTLQDNIIEMKIQCKQLERAGKKAEKEEQNYKKKAKEALKKNNEEGAKLYLMSAASKPLTCQRTALKMEYMCGQIKSMKNNEMFINSFSALTNAATQQMGNFNFESMSNQMDLFNKKMDQMMINNKMVGQIMNTQQLGTDSMVDEMKYALQQQIAMQQKNKLMQQEKVIYQKHKAEGDKFMNQLKDL